MLQSLRDLNTVVGPMKPADVYDLTPKELDYMLAGGYQRQFDQLQASRFINQNVTQPVILVEKADESQLDQFMKQQQANIKAMTDEKLQAQQEADQERQKLFAKMFIYKKGR